MATKNAFTFLSFKYSSFSARLICFLASSDTVFGVASLTGVTALVATGDIFLPFLLTTSAMMKVTSIDFDALCLPLWENRNNETCSLVWGGLYAVGCMKSICCHALVLQKQFDCFGQVRTHYMRIPHRITYAVFHAAVSALDGVIKIG